MKGAVGKIALLALCLLLLGPMQSFAADPTQEAILRELQALKMRVGELENKLQLAQKSAQDAQKAAAEAYATSGRSLKMSQEVAKTNAVRYEGGGDLGDFEPERQYGFNVSWNLLPDTRLSLEYLRGDYANDYERDLVTTQLAAAF